MISRVSTAATLWFAGSLAAQQLSTDTARAVPVVVTATRVPLSRNALPVAVTVITGAELRARGITRVSDALQDVTSAYLAQAGSAGATTSLFLRGGESKYVKVLIDGVPANDPGGTFDFASLSTDNVERIEVVRGPASVLYGADAVTGVVHIITRRGAGPPRGEVELRAGMSPRDPLGGAGDARLVDVSARSDGGISAAGAGGSYSVALAHHATTGLYDLNNAARDNVVSTRAVFAPGHATELRLAVRFTDHRYNYPTSSGGTPQDSNAFFAEHRTVIGLEVEQAVVGNVRATLALSSSANQGGTDDAMDSPGGDSYVSHDRTRRRGAELRVQLLPGSWGGLSVGAQVEHQDQRSRADGQFGAFPPFSSTFSADRHNLGVYGEAVVTPVAAVTITMGGRADDNEQFGRFHTGRAGVSWRPAAATRLRLTAGTAFREPTFAENYSTGFVTGNPGLQPERARTVDAGVDQDLAGGAGRLSLTAFAQRFHNMIDYTGDDAACGYSYCNVAAAQANGVEGELQAQLGGPLNGSLGVTLLRTRVLAPGFDSSDGGLYRAGETLIRRPERTATIGFSYRGAGPLTGSARLLLVGARADEDFRGFPARRVTLPGYHRMDVGAEYRLPPAARARASATLRVENLENTGYQTVFNFLAPRRTVSLGVRARM